MDNQRDFYIKEKFEQDDLISKKAEDVFNNFFKGEMKMEEEKPNIDEKVVDINSAKDKKLKMKKIMSIVATLVVVFLSANVYAATQGYNNIFFIIRNLVAPESANGREEILSDKDITISYQPIEIADNLKIQVNGLVIEENKATLMLKIDEKYPLKHCPKQYLVYDVTDERHDLLEKQVILKVNDKKTSGESSYMEEIEMIRFKNDTKKLKLEISDQNELVIAEMEIDLENKSINVLSSQNNKLQKLSETELKEVLGYYANFLAYDAIDSDDLVNFEYSREELMQNALAESAALLIDKNEKEISDNGYTVEKIHSAIKEICGVYYENPIEIEQQNSIIYYDKNQNRYVYNNVGGGNLALCLAIQDISFYNGIYTIDYVYCFPGDGNYEENSIEELDKFKSTIELSINKDYKYAKYCINNFDEMVGERYTEENYEINDITNNENEESDRNDLLISDDLIQFDTKFYLIDEISKQKWNPSMGTSILYSDLDSDGIDDEISINVEKADGPYSSDTYKYSLNGVEFESYYGTELYIVDLNKDDNNVEIVIYDPGPSDDPTYSIYSKVNGKMILQKYIQGALLKNDEKGNILSDFWYDNITNPSIYFKYYYIKNNKFEEKTVDIQKIKDVEFKIRSELIPSEGYKTYYFTQNFNDVINKYQTLEDGKILRPITINDEFTVLDVEIVEYKWNEDYTEEIYKIEIKLNNNEIGYLYHMQWAG